MTAWPEKWPQEFHFRYLFLIHASSLSNFIKEYLSSIFIRHWILTLVYIPICCTLNKEKCSSQDLCISNNFILGVHYGRDQNWPIKKKTEKKLAKWCQFVWNVWCNFESECKLGTRKGNFFSMHHGKAWDSYTFRATGCS